MRFNVLSYIIAEGFRNVLKNKKSTGASLMIMCATMLIFGLFFLIGENVNHIVRGLEEEQGMQAFLKQDATDEEIKKVGEQIKALDFVSRTTYVSKEDGLNLMKERLGEKFLAGYEKKNPLSASYVVNLTELTKSKEVKEAIEKIEGIKNVELRTNTVETLINVANGIQMVSAVILVLLVVISIFIIANTIKLTVHARRKEISIMKYVGATNSFIRGPFVVEGIVIGVVSALLSILILGLSYNAVVNQILTSTLATQIDMQLLTFTEMFPLVITVYLSLGIGIGVLGSLISMRKYLDV